MAAYVEMDQVTKTYQMGEVDDQSCGWYFFSGGKGRICGRGLHQVEQEKQRC